ncbi:MAG: M48 family metalloprotease [Gammaproteobacteria bacterium]
MQSSIEQKRPARRRHRALCVALVLALGLAPPAALAQADNLPRLGDAGAEDLSPAAERRLGERIMRDLRRDAAVSGDVEIGDYLNGLAATLTASAQGHSFELFLVSDPSLNAFALPGGYIGVHTGLIVAAETESELASVVAHEIGHVTQRHIARMLSGQRQTTLGTLAAVVLAALAARSNPQAAAGIVTMAAGAQQQQMLAFSRDAEREADRVGLDTLREAGFDPNGMVSFFGRLQQSTRTYESSAPAYMRSHPMTVERIADMQARVQEGRYRQHPDSLEFRLARARLRAQGDGSVDALRTERARFERQLRERTTNDETAAWFGVAVGALAQRDYPAAERAIEETRRRLPEGHPFVERLAAQARLQAGDAAGALALARAAAARFPAARALVHLQAEAMIALRDHRAAVAFLEDRLAVTRTDAALWRLMARARSGLGETALAHRASAESYALDGAWLAAVEQLELARRDGGLDFYAASQLDARIKVLKAEYTREQEDAKAGLR